MHSHGIASLAQIVAIMNSVPVVLIQATNQGTGGRIAAAFPSLDQYATVLLEDGEPVVLRFDDEVSACAAYNRICSDLDVESVLIEGEVHFVRPNREITTFDLAFDKERPVVTPFCTTTEPMLSRI